MHKTLAKTLLAAAAFAAGLSQTAHAGAYADGLIIAAPGHNGQRAPFTDGAHRPATEATMLPVVAQQGRSVCAIRGFDPYRDGMRKPDPYTDGGHISSRDGFTDGARIDARDNGECLS
jgi:hypothetical protein